MDITLDTQDERTSIVIGELRNNRRFSTCETCDILRVAKTLTSSTKMLSEKIDMSMAVLNIGNKFSKIDSRNMAVVLLNILTDKMIKSTFKASEHFKSIKKYRRIFEGTIVERLIQHPENYYGIVDVYGDELVRICSYAVGQGKLGLEVGANVIGLHISENHSVVSMFADPGLDITATSIENFPCRVYHAITTSFAVEQGACDIGNWHSHHFMDIKYPSGGDDSTVKHYANETDSVMRNYLMFIVTMKPINGNSCAPVNVFVTCVRYVAYRVDSSEWTMLKLPQMLRPIGGLRTGWQNRTSPLRMKWMTEHQHDELAYAHTKLAIDSRFNIHL